MIDTMFRIVSALYLWRTTAPDVVPEDIHRIVKHIISMDSTFYCKIFRNHDDLVTVYHQFFPDSLGILTLETPLDDDMINDTVQEVATTSTGQRNNNCEQNLPPTIQHIPLKLPLRIIQTITRIFHEIFVQPLDNYKKDIEQKMLISKVSKFVHTTMTSKATDEDAAIIANEPSLKAKHLQELIDQRLNERSKAIEKIGKS
jgi:hypothetical protein